MTWKVCLISSWFGMSSANSAHNALQVSSSVADTMASATPGIKSNKSFDLSAVGCRVFLMGSGPKGTYVAPITANKKKKRST